MRISTSCRLATAAATLGSGIAVLAQNDGPFLTTGAFSGIDAVTGARPARKNINSLCRDGGPEWDIYVQALRDFQWMADANKLSYFQIAGIHGLPYVPWNGVDGPGEKDMGYCPHGDVLFLAWHRPYLATFEMVLSYLAQNIASQYTGPRAQNYTLAAQSLRIPFWDWASDPSLPPVTAVEYLTINGPRGPPQSIRNPLYSYQFHHAPLDAALFPDSPGNETLRCPDANRESRPLGGNTQLAQTGLKGLVYRVFEGAQSYVEMATMQTGGNSFEAPHNEVHMSAACDNGSMWDIRYSAYDPLFYLHHANVDRLFALWQAIYPNQSSFAGSYTNEGQFATPPAENVSSSSPLRPFYDGARNFWTADSVADTRVLGYAYPETADAWNLTAAQLAAAVAGRVNALYAPPPPSPSPSSAGAASVVGPGGSSAAGSDYALAVTVDRAELPLPCRVVLHLAGAGPDPVGRVALLALPRGGVARAELPLLRVVVGRGGGRGSVEGPAKGVLDGDGGDGDVGKEDGGGGVGGKAGWEDAIGAGGAAVARLLQKGLRAEIVMLNGTKVPIESAPSLEVNLLDRDFTPRVSDDTFATFGSARTWSALSRRVPARKGR